MTTLAAGIPFPWGGQQFTWPITIRQYTGLLSAKKTNERFLNNLRNGQTGLSVAFDLPTQLWLDIDDELCRGQVGEVGVPICHIGDMETLLAGIDLSKVNTSMTINAPALWLAALYIAVGEAQGQSPAKLKFTVQNDLAKEYIARGAYVLDPITSRRLQTEMFRYCIKHSPRSRAMNACSYHLGEVGGTAPVEMGFALANAFQILDSIKALVDTGEVTSAELWDCARLMSFFVWVGEELETQTAKFRAAHMIWDEQLEKRYGITDPSYRLLIMGGQSSSIHLTREQPENNIVRLATSVYAASYGGLRALQISCADEAFRTPTETMQRLSLRTQQVIYYETDLRCGETKGQNELFIGSCEDKWYGSRHMEALTARMKQEMETQIANVESQLSEEERLRYMKRQLLLANRQRIEAIEKGGVDAKGIPFGKPLVGRNCFTEPFPEALMTGLDYKPQNDRSTEERMIQELHSWKASRDRARFERSMLELEQALNERRLCVPYLIECAKARATTGEIGGLMRKIFGEYRPANALELLGSKVLDTEIDVHAARERCEQFELDHGHRIKGIIGATGLDGHSSGSEQVAIRAAAVGMEITYLGNRRRASEIAESALQNGADFVGISIMSGAVITLTETLLSALEERGIGDTPLVIGGIISDIEREELLRNPSVVGIFTPTDWDLTKISVEIITAVDKVLKQRS